MANKDLALDKIENSIKELIEAYFIISNYDGRLIPLEDGLYVVCGTKESIVNLLEES